MLRRNRGEMSKMLLDERADAWMHLARMLVEATDCGTDALLEEATMETPD